MSVSNEQVDALIALARYYAPRCGKCDKIAQHSHYSLMRGSVRSKYYSCDECLGRSVELRRRDLSRGETIEHVQLSLAAQFRLIATIVPDDDRDSLSTRY